MQRGYNEQSVDRSIAKAKQVPRHQALKKRIKKEAEKRPVFAIHFDPRMPSVTNIISKHWRAMRVQDQYLSEVFKEPPLTAYKRQKNIKDHLIKAKVADPPSVRPKRTKNGMSKCGKNCSLCPYIKEGKSISVNRKSTWQIMNNVNCQTSNLIYLIECNKENCKTRYIGETGRTLQNRIADHRGYVINEHLNTATGFHFNTPGHSVSNLTVTIIEKVRKSDESYRKQREKYHIIKFNTYYKGLNQQ